MTRTIPFALMGLGNIGRNLLDILVHRQTAIEKDFDLRFVLVGAADSTGAAISADGLDMAQLRDMKSQRQGAATYPGAGHPGMSPLDMIDRLVAFILVDAAPTNLEHGDPGLSCQRHAMEKGWHIVAADKGPLVLAYSDLMARARQQGVRILFSGTVAGGLPTVNIGARDLAGSGVTKVEGILNGTTNYILTRMADEGLPYETALQGAQNVGIAEANPSLDVDGWDAASKLVIVANSVLRRPTALSDLKVEGIRNVTAEDIAQAKSRGEVIKLIALAERQGDDYALSVAPRALPENHILARTGIWDMAVAYHTDYMGVISAIIEEKGPVPTSAAVLRDMITLYTDGWF